MPSVRTSNKNRTKSASSRATRSKSTKEETKKAAPTKTSRSQSTSKTTKPTRQASKSQSQKPTKKSPVKESRDRSTSKKVFKPAARQSTRGKIKPSSKGDETTKASRSSPVKEQPSSQRSATRGASRSQATKSPGKKSISKVRPSEKAKPSPFKSPQKRTRGSKVTESPAKTSKADALYGSPQRPKRSRGFQTRAEKSPKNRSESKASRDRSADHSPGPKTKNAAKKASPGRSTRRAATPKKATPRKATPKKVTPAKAEIEKGKKATSPSKKASVSKAEIIDVSIPDPVTGFKRDASGKLIKRSEVKRNEAKEKEIKEKLDMLLDDDECEVEIAVLSKNMEIENSGSSESESEDEEPVNTRGYNLYEDWKMLVAVANYIEKTGSQRGLLGTFAWGNMQDPFSNEKLLEGEKDAKSMCKRYATALRYLREEEIEKIQEFGGDLSIKELKKMRLLFEKLDDDTRRLIGMFRPLTGEGEGHPLNRKLEMVVDAVNDIEDFPEEEKARRQAERDVRLEQLEQEKEVERRKSPRKKQKANHGEELEVVKEKMLSRADKKRLVEQEFKILKEDWQYETKSLTVNEMFRSRKFEAPFDYDPNLSLYVDFKQGFRQFVKESIESVAPESKISGANKWGRLSNYAKEYGLSFEDVLTIFNSVSCDAKDLEAYLETEDSTLLWTSQEDKDLVANNPVAMRYLIKIKGPKRIASRREYLKDLSQSS